MAKNTLHPDTVFKESFVGALNVPKTGEELLTWVGRESEKYTNKNLAKGILFEWMCKYYLAHSGKFRFKNVWLKHECPGHVLEDMGFPRQDFGDDIVVEYDGKREENGEKREERNKKREGNGGKYAIVQCKYRTDPLRPIPHNEGRIGNFLERAFYSREFGPPVFMTSACRAPAFMETQYGGRVICVLRDDLTSPMMAPVICELFASAVPLVKKEPFPCQEKALEVLDDSARKGARRVITKMICGAGKTLLQAFFIIRNPQYKTIVISAPWLELIDQSFREFADCLASYGYSAEFLVVGSRSDSARGAGVRVTTSPEEIGEFLKKDRFIVLSTYKSLSRVVAAVGGAKRKVDLYIADEAHHLVGVAKNRGAARVLDDRAFPCGFRLFMTATVCYHTATDKKTSMHHAELFGKVVFDYPLHQAIKDKRACDYELVAYLAEDAAALDATALENTMEVTGGDVSKGARGGVTNVVTNEITSTITNVKALVYRRMLVSLLENGGSRHVLVYCRTTKESAELLRAFTADDKKKMVVARIDSLATATSNRRKRVESDARTKGASVLLTVNMYKEGKDLPWLDTVFYACPLTDPVSIIQSACRPLRVYGDKKAKIVVPALLDNPRDFADVKNKDFSFLVNLICELSREDPDLVLHKNGGSSPAKPRLLFKGLGVSRGSPPSEPKYTTITETRLGEMVAGIRKVVFDRRNRVVNIEPTWQTLLLEVIAKIKNDAGVFTKAEVDKCIPDMLKKKTSVGKTPSATLARELQILRDQGLVQFVDGRGTYKWTQ